MPPKKIPLTFNLFYGWYILASSFTILFFNSGARFSFGVVFKPMIREFGWDRSSISLAFFLNMTLFALSLTIVGRFYDRFGPKWVILISTFFLSIGYTLISLINSLWEFFLYYGILAAIGSGGTSVPLIAALPLARLYLAIPWDISHLSRFLPSSSYAMVGGPHTCTSA